jgi:5'(3')-deoxyribonucleotidase
MRVAVDMDEVVADAFPAQLTWLTERYGYAFDPVAYCGRKLAEVVAGEHHQALQAHLHEGSFFGDLIPIEGAKAALTMLNEHAEVFITTAAMEYPKSLPYKFDWLQRHFPFIDSLRFVFCGDKSIINADYLIDDNARHFERFGGEGILFSAPHNAGEQRYRRDSNWSEALALLGLA